MTNQFVLKSSPKIFKNYKSEFPAQTILRCKKALAGLGIDLKKLKYEEGKIGKDFLIYGRQLTYNNHYIASGKGTTRQLCEASAYSETVERIPVGLSPLTPYLNLEIDLEKGSFLPGFFYKNRGNSLNAIDVKSFLKYFPLLDLQKEEEEMTKYWVDAFSLTENKYKKVPHLLIKRISGSNGCAAGNTLEEAIVQAFCEVCERYSLIEHILQRIPAPTIDPNSIKDKNIQKAIELFNSMNIDVEIKDLTLGNKIPVMGVLFTNQNLAHEKNTLKKKMFYKTLHAGSHFDPNQAIMRCFVEEWQVANPNIHSFMYHPEFNIVDNYFSHKEKMEILNRLEKDYVPLISTNRSFENFNFLDKCSPTIPLDAISNYDTADFLEEIKTIKDISKKNGWETLIIDYSVPEIPLKIVRAVTPSISDILRYAYPGQEKITDFPKKKRALLLEDFLSNKKVEAKELISAAENELAVSGSLSKTKTDIKELISAAENELIEKIITPYSALRFLKYSLIEILAILKKSYLVLGNRKKHQRIDNLLEHYSN